MTNVAQLGTASQRLRGWLRGRDQVGPYELRRDGLFWAIYETSTGMRASKTGFYWSESAACAGALALVEARRIGWLEAEMGVGA